VRRTGISIAPRLLAALAAAFVLGLVFSAEAQEEKDTPSQKVKEALDQLGKAPGAAEKAVKGVVEAGKAKLQEAFGEQIPTKKAEADPLEVPTKKTEPKPLPRYSGDGKRDPFRPLAVKSRPSRVREGASPLERKDVGQFKLVGIVWDVKEPRAMVEDTDGLGYTIRVGTPIGDKDGKVKAIKPTEVVVEEVDVDFFGARKIYQRSIRLPQD
jgi:Tfp pilus assembly protein PilP